jgi:hypothetical protein
MCFPCTQHCNRSLLISGSICITLGCYLFSSLNLVTALWSVINVKFWLMYGLNLFIAKISANLSAVKFCNFAPKFCNLVMHKLLATLSRL